MLPRTAMTPYAKHAEDVLLATLRSVLGFGALPKDGQPGLHLGIRRSPGDASALQVVISSGKTMPRINLIMRHRDPEAIDIMVFHAEDDGEHAREITEGSDLPSRANLRLIYSASAMGGAGIEEAKKAARLAAASVADLKCLARAAARTTARPRWNPIKALASLMFEPEEITPPIEPAEGSLDHAVRRLRSSRSRRLRDLGMALDACGALPPEALRAISIRVGQPLMRILDGLDQGAVLDAGAQSDLDRIQSTLGVIVQNARTKAMAAAGEDVGIIARVSANRLSELLPAPAGDPLDR